MRRPLALGLLALAAATAGAAPAGGVVVPQRSIAGLELGMTERKVRALMGRPLAVRQSQNDFGRYRELVYARVRVSFQSGPRATALTTTSPNERTAGGVGVGSTRAQVRAALRGVRCKREFGVDHCWLGDDARVGAVVTDLLLRHGRVSRITIGYVID
jgi:hypothetical protein